MEWVKKRWLLQNPRLRIRQPPTPIRMLLLCILTCPIFLVMRIALGKRLWISLRKKSKNSEFKTDVDGKNLLFHFAKGGDVVAKVKRVGSQKRLCFCRWNAPQRYRLRFPFHGSGPRRRWPKERTHVLEKQGQKGTEGNVERTRFIADQMENVGDKPGNRRQIGSKPDFHSQTTLCEPLFTLMEPKSWVISWVMTLRKWPFLISGRSMNML